MLDKYAAANLEIPMQMVLLHVDLRVEIESSGGILT